MLRRGQSSCNLQGHGSDRASQQCSLCSRGLAGGWRGIVISALLANLATRELLGRQHCGQTKDCGRLLLTCGTGDMAPWFLDVS